MNLRKSEKERQLSACINLGYNLSLEKFKKNIEVDLINNPSLKELLSEKANVFVSWAVKERVNYVADIFDEVNDFLNLRFGENRIRLYNYNVKLWYRLINEVFRRDNYTCRYCGRIGGKLEADHIIPFSKGGSDELDNLVTSCRTCNRQKKDKSITEFLNWKTANAKKNELLQP
jgi:5-methylcytosine-specific restriction endonuclease McrA